MKYIYSIISIKIAGEATHKYWLRGLDLNQRPSGYEPDELPDCSTPRHQWIYTPDISKMQAKSLKL
jgi:hypothetical protein